MASTAEPLSESDTLHLSYPLGFAYFPRALQSFLSLHHLTWLDLRSSLLTEGLPLDMESLNWWQAGGYPTYAWDHITLALSRIFSVDPVAFFVPDWEGALLAGGDFPRDRTFGQLFCTYLLPGEGAKVARALTAAGFQTKRQSVSYWRMGVLPRHGLALIPTLATILGCPLSHLVPLIATPVGHAYPGVAK